MVVLGGDEDETVAGVDGLRPGGDVLVVVLLVRRTRDGGGGEQRDIELLEVEDLVGGGLTLLRGLGDPLPDALAETSVADGTDDDTDLHEKTPSHFC